VQLQNGLSQSEQELNKLGHSHKVEMEKVHSKMRVLEETLNKRNEK